MAVETNINPDHVGSQDLESGDTNALPEVALSDSSGSEIVMPDYSDNLEAIGASLGSIESILQAPAPQLDTAFNSTVLSWADRYSIKIPFNKNYVFWKTSDYSYTLVVGDFSFDSSSSTFSGDIESSIIWEAPHQGHNFYSYYVSDLFSLDLTARTTVVYSDLGPFPTLSGPDLTSFTFLFAFVAFFFCWTLRGFFSWLLRPASTEGGANGAQTVVVD